MQRYLRKSPVLWAAVVGFIFLIPLIVLELVNRGKFHETFPLALFTFAWVLQTAFILILVPVVKNIQSGKSVTENPIDFVVRVVGLIVIAYIWSGWVIDQWPCLMGVPICD